MQMEYHPYENEPQELAVNPYEPQAQGALASPCVQSKVSSREPAQPCQDVTPRVTCPKCGPIQLQETYQSTYFTYVLALLFCCIPFCVNRLKDQLFFCSNCHMQLGRIPWCN